MKITNIEVIDHVYEKCTGYEYYIITYASGKRRKYESHEVPKTVKAFMKCHYDEYHESLNYKIYKYRAINIIK